MAKMFPDFQTFLDVKRGDVIGVTKITILTTGSDHVSLPQFTDARILTSTVSGSLPTFYASDGDKQISIDGATVGTKYTLVSRHRNRVNFNEGG